MVFEPLGKSLLWYIQQNGYHGFPIWYVRDIALQLLSALYFLHDHEMIHTDLKLENILFVTDETMEENFINTKHYLDAMYTAHSHGKLPLPYEQPQSMSEDRLKLPRNLKQVTKRQGPPLPAPVVVVVVVVVPP
jgi:serine/threonine protein kinase